MLENTDTPQEIEAITEEIDRFQRYIDEYLPGVVAFGLRVLMALVLFFIGSRLIKLLRRIVRRSMERAGHDKWVLRFVKVIVISYDFEK